MEAFKYRDELKQRTKIFALRVIKLYHHPTLSGSTEP